jgi:hypothetical protein
MTTRLLPTDEWARLAGTELETVWPHLPDTARVIVVENEAGAIVGCWALFTSVHAEGVWIAPEHRKGSVVARRLLVGMKRQLEDMDATAFMTGAVSDDVRHIIQALGGTALPGEQYVIERGSL